MPSDFDSRHRVTSIDKRIRFFVAATCSPLKKYVGGTWIPASCTAGPNGEGAYCNLQCYNGYHLKGSSTVECKDEGWKSVNGNSIPTCVGEYGRVERSLVFLLSRDVNYRLLLKFWPLSLNQKE